MMNQESWSELKIKAIIALFTIIALGLCAWCFSIGYFVIVQNLIYLPIIIASAYFPKRGLVFSTVISLVYLLLLVVFSNNHTVILGGAVRSIVFVIVGAVVAFISIKKQSLEKELTSYKGHLESLVAEKTSSLEQLIHEKTTVINELKQAELALRASEEKFRAIYENAPVLIDGFDEKGRCVLWNKACRDLFGWSLDEINEHDDPLTLFYPDPEIREKVVASVTKAPESKFEEWHPHTKDGRELTCLWANFTLPDGAIMNVGYDITDLKQAEAIMRESEERLKLAVNHSEMVFARTDAELKYTWIQNQAQEYQNVNVIGKSDLEVADNEGTRKLTRLKQEVFDKKQKMREEIFFPLTSGGITYDVLAEPVFDAFGSIVGVKTAALNITGRKQMEKELLETKQRLLMANKATNDVIWDWDVSSDMQQWNETGTAVFGWTEIVERPVNANWWVERVHPDDRERVHDSFFAVVNNPELDVWRDEYHFLKTDGTYADVLDRGYVLRDEKGKAIRMVGAMQDITAYKKAEEALLQAKKAESLEHMAGAVAHHYNNLMGVVLGNLELAELPGFAPEQVASLLIEARSAANRAADLSRLMLAYLGLSAGTKKSLDLGAICREALADIRPRLSDKVRLELSGPPDGLIVQADSAQMRQVLDALVSNAVESFEDEESVIRVTVTEAPAEDLPLAGVKPADWRPERGRRCVCLEVADTGAGMAPETLEKAFDPFFSTRFTGRGLGLPVVLGIVKAHEGGIILESQPGSGTIVRVLLPLSEEKPVVRSSRSAPSAPLPKQGLVLVVDDEPALSKMAQLMLASLGFEAACAPNGAEALELFRRRPQEFLCVLCDLSMPGMSGWETLTALRSVRADIPVILCSGHNEAVVMAYVQTDMPQVFLGKPYDKAKLTAALAAVCSPATPAMKPLGESG